ncbi:MAG: hypothetical protein ACI4IN_02980 [Eubacterium sp.]
MTDLIINGDYVTTGQGSGLQMVEHIPRILQDVTMHLGIKRCKFYPNKDYGTALQGDMRPITRYALACARQALYNFDGVYVKNAVQNEDTITYYLVINNEERQVSVKYEDIQ